VASVATLSAGLTSAIADFAENNSECWRPEVVRNRCGEFSFMFLDACSAYGLTAELVWLESVSSGEHCVVRVGDVLVDWTYRQFAPHAAVPEIWTEVPQGWTESAGA
jgi:hypothetical protein